MANKNPNSTNYEHTFEPNTTDLTLAMDYDLLGRPVIRTTGAPPTTLPWEYLVGVGQVEGFQNLQAFGYREDVDAGDVRYSLWNCSEAERIAVRDDASNDVYAISTSDQDTETGTGARTILVQGIDQNWDQTSETVLLNGTSPVALLNSYRAVERVTVTTAGSQRHNVGKIFIGTGEMDDSSIAPPLIDCYVHPFDGASEIGQFVVPRNHTAFVLDSVITIGGVADFSKVTIRGYVRTELGVEYTTGALIMTAGTLQTKESVPLTIPEKTVVGYRIISAHDNESMSARIRYILANNDYLTV
jgi:hypothetical protein